MKFIPVKISEKDLYLYRLISFIGAVAYFIFGFILLKVKPLSYDPLVGRIVVSGMVFLFFLLSFVNEWIKNNLVYLAYLSAYVFAFYYTYLLYVNNFSFEYALGMMTIIFGVSVVFKNTQSLLFFILLSFFVVGIAFLCVDYSIVNPFLYMSILATASIVVCITMGSRFKIQGVLEEKNKSLENAYKEINDQKKLVEYKNKNITDSINYAKKIQKAIIQPKENLQLFLPDSFIFYRVKDIVSGDFYWFYSHHNKVTIVAADCTGHGVPGALMSMLGNSFLDDIIKEKNISMPGEILARLNSSLVKTLKQESEERSANDGMDVSVCTIDCNLMQLQYAGAYRPLCMIRDGTLQKINGDKIPVGNKIHLHNEEYTNHVIEIQSGDTFYMYTDGYADQFGGPSGKKFMTKKLNKLLLDIHNLEMPQQKVIIEDKLNKWRGNLEQVDDILIIGFKI